MDWYKLHQVFLTWDTYMLFAMMVVYASLFLLMTCIWAIAMVMRYPAVVDLFWAPACFQAACIYIFLFDELDIRSFFILFILALWVIRLTAYLYITRVSMRKPEVRYDGLVGSSRCKKWAYFFQFQVQAVLVFMISIPFYWISQQYVPEFDLLDYAATVTCLIGIIGEAVADWQLYLFKKRFPKSLCMDRLWYYSRHPNYFFNALIWLGFALFSVSSHAMGYVGLLSPIILYWMMMTFSIPITEKWSVQHKGEAYRRYQLTTPAFFPNFFKL